VGKLREGMKADIKIGALPDAHVTGTVTKIFPKAKKEENATVFPVEIALDPDSAQHLRAGYSANAEIIVARRDSVLSIPERVVSFEGDSAWVTVQLADGQTDQRAIRTGLSDAIQIEVVSGLSEGDRVLEKPTRKIE
jgi:HlyD family secretion protein